jgi:hypothetical protein
LFLASKYEIPESLKESKILQQKKISNELPQNITKEDLFNMIKQRKQSIVGKWLYDTIGSAKKD